MILETDRLRVVPLKAEQFRLFTHSVGEMEQALGLSPSMEKPDKHVRAAMKAQYDLLVRNPEYNILLTLWQIILKSENKSIGSACFKNIPDEDGVVEIGYGINSPYRNNGYMTEALQVLSGWGLQQKNVRAVIAITDLNNKASQNVLLKSGFAMYRSEKNILWWQKETTIIKEQ